MKGFFLAGQDKESTSQERGGLDKVAQEAKPSATKAKSVITGPVPRKNCSVGSGGTVSDAKDVLGRRTIFVDKKPWKLSGNACCKNKWNEERNSFDLKCFIREMGFSCTSRQQSYMLKWKNSVDELAIKYKSGALKGLGYPHQMM